MKAPLQNITNKFKTRGIETLTNKQNSTVKEKRHENSKFQKETLSTCSEAATALKNKNNNQMKTVLREKTISEACNYESDVVKARALKYAQSVQNFKDEIFNLRKQVQDISKECESLRNLVTQKDKELNRIRELNENLHKCCINSADEVKTILEQNNKKTEKQMLYNGYLPSGYMKKDDSKVHLGRDVLISKDCYYLAVSNIRSNSVFVRNLAIAVFGEETLMKSTFSGRGSNRNKQTKNPECGKLDERKCLAIKDFYRYWLMTERNMDDIKADIEAQNTFNYIRKKISDMKTMPRSVKKGINSEEKEIAPLLEGNTMSDEENESTLPQDVLDFAHALRNDNEEMVNLEEDEKGEENEEEESDQGEENNTKTETLNNGTQMEEDSKKAATLIENDSIFPKTKSISDRESLLGDIESLTDDNTSLVNDAEEKVERRTEDWQEWESFQEQENFENRVPNVEANEMLDVEHQNHISSLEPSKQIKILPDGIHFSDVM